jgi:hypothetical protein
MERKRTVPELLPYTHVSCFAAVEITDNLDNYSCVTCQQYLHLSY